MATSLNFTTTKRNHKSDAVDNIAKITAANAAVLSDAELAGIRQLQLDAFRLLNLEQTKFDSTATVQCTLAAGSMVSFSVTV